MMAGSSACHTDTHDGKEQCMLHTDTHDGREQCMSHSDTHDGREQFMSHSDTQDGREQCMLHTDTHDGREQCIQLNSIQTTLIIPQGAILLWSWWARKIMIHKVKRTIQQTQHNHQRVLL